MGSVYYTNIGEGISLDKEIGRGGEGPVYSVHGRASDVAKIYSKKLSSTDHEKLLLMVSNPPTDPSYSSNKHRSIAWPSSVLYADRHKTQFAGFVMPKADLKVFKKALVYMSPDDRREQYFGSISWQHLFYAARNISSAVAAIHERGYCVGDINESNILIAPDALITLIDCDSFQVKDTSANKIYRCHVGKEDYTAPELLGRSYEEVDRTPETDNFALGVLIFQLLMEGFHPYSGRWLLSGDSPRISDKINKGLYPYGRKLNELAPQPDAPPFEIIHPEIQGLFNKCFVDGHGRPEERPSAKEWMKVLSALMRGFQRCSKNENHRYLNHLHYCPWCQIADRRGEENDSFPNPAGQQIPLIDPTKSLKTLDERIEYLRTYIDMALIDGVLTPDERDYIIQQGLQLQIPRKDIQKIINKEVQKRGIGHGQSSGTISTATPTTIPKTTPPSSVTPKHTIKMSSTALSTTHQASQPISIPQTPASSPTSLGTTTQIPQKANCRKIIIWSVIGLACFFGFFIVSSISSHNQLNTATDSSSRFSVSELTVLDKEIKLMWTRDANIPGKAMDWHKANEYIKQLNKQKYAGYNDWRLPSIEEFQTLIDYTKNQGIKFDNFNQGFNKIGFKNMERYGYYWSSTRYPESGHNAFVVSVSVGYVGGGYVSSPANYYVWPVRSTDINETDKEYERDLNCNLNDIPSEYKQVCKNYSDASFLEENCWNDKSPSSLEMRCSAYVCAKRRNAGMSCE